MSDKYKSLFEAIDGSFIEGEQPTAQKLTNIVNLTKSSLAQLEKAVGMIRDSLLVGRTGNGTWVPIPAKNSYDTVSVEDLRLDFPSNIVSVARAIGPMSGLNPRYLSGQSWLKSDLPDGAIGILLKHGVTEQQLPFKPLSPGDIGPLDFNGPDAGYIFAIKATSYEPSLEVGKYYINEQGRLFTGAPVKPGTRVKYSFVIGEGDGYIGSGYNVIPDPSILNFTLAERDNKTFVNPDFGACKVSVFAVNEEALVVDISLPEVISTPFSKLSRSHEVEDSDPVGKVDVDGSGLRRYTLPEYYPTSGSIQDNTMYLYYTETGKVIPEAIFERVSEFTVRAHLPARYKLRIKGDTDEVFNTIGVSNTKHFFLITNGTQLGPLVGKLRLEMEEHSHNGLDSVRVSHNDLADVNHIMPTLPAQLNIYANVDGTIPEKDFELDGTFIAGTQWFNRKLSKGNFFEENPHPYYLHRLGYLGGGTDGAYALVGPRQFGASLANGFTGDLVLMPVTSAENTDEGGYTWESTDEINYENNNSASHSLWFGLPWEVKVATSAGAINDRERNGSARMYFDPWIRVMGSSSGLYSSLTEPFSTEGLGILNTGTIGADLFNNTGITNAVKGLNIQRGNFFFGYNEHKFLSTTERNKGKSSFNILASEFNAVVTANEKATQSGELRWKGQAGNRSGFAVKAIEGSSVNFSIGGLTGTPGTAVNTASFTNTSIVGSNYNLAGSFTVEAAFGNQLISTTQAHGSGILMSPGTGARRLFPWQLKSPLIGSPGFSSATKYAGWKNLEDINVNFAFASAQNLGGVSHIFSILDTEAIKNLLIFQGSADLTESVKNKNSFPFGKLILEGSSGIDLLVSRGTYSSSVAGILNVLDLSEVRFWAREDLKADIDNEVRDNHAAGANLNLMYGYGKAYSKFGVNLPWGGSEGNIKGLEVERVDTESKGKLYTALRTETLESLVNKDTRGSQIRQASFIEAMEGFRNDPNQPFTVSYRLPFRVMQSLEWLENEYTIETGITIPAWNNFSSPFEFEAPEDPEAEPGAPVVPALVTKLFVPSAIISTLPIKKIRIITDNIEQLPAEGSGVIGFTINPAIKACSYKDQPPIEEGEFSSGGLNLVDDVGYGVFVDQIIRYYDYLYWANREYTGQFIPGVSLLNFSVDLNYSKLVYGDSESDRFGEQVPYPGLDKLNDFLNEDENDLISYISGKQYAVVRYGNNLDSGIVIRTAGEVENLRVQESFTASLMLGYINENENTFYAGSDSIGEARWYDYIEGIKNQIDPGTTTRLPVYNGSGDSPIYIGGEPMQTTLEAPKLGWYIQLQGESRDNDEKLYRYAPYELFMTSDGKLNGLGTDQKLVMAFDGYINLTFKTLGGAGTPFAGLIDAPRPPAP